MPLPCLLPLLLLPWLLLLLLLLLLRLWVAVVHMPATTIQGRHTIPSSC
jgi:cytoskeletal protein RodZ